jgi:processing peptidase subunit alpha
LRITNPKQLLLLLLLLLQGSVVMTVLTYLLGGGNSFSSGGPGKGMHSRLYTRVLNYHHWVHSCSSYSNTLNNTGLMGIQASCDPGQAQKMLDVMCGEYLL